MSLRVFVVVLLALMAPIGFSLYSFETSANAEIQIARKAQCGIAYNLLLGQLLERDEAPDGKANSFLLSQLQILESEPCAEKSLREDLLPQGGVERLLPLARDVTTASGNAAFVAEFYSLMAEVEKQSSGPSSSGPDLMARVQAHFVQTMPLLERLARAPDAGLRDTLQQDIEAANNLHIFAGTHYTGNDPGSPEGAIESADSAYVAALQQTLESLDRGKPPVTAAARVARSQLYRLFDVTAVWQHKALQSRIDSARLNSQLALGAGLALVGVMLLLGLWLLWRFTQNLGDRIQSLVSASRRTAKGELGLAVGVSGKGKVSELEQAFNEMTADLRKSYQKIIDELAAALETAQQAERAKSDFLHNVTHEIRTPINVILGMSHLALQSGLDPRQRDQIGKVSKAAKELNAIVNDILDFSKIESGTMTAQKIEFDLSDVLDPLVEDVKSRASAKGLEFRLDVAADLERALTGDPRRLGQILAHFGNNALKFTERGSIKLEVQALPSQGDRIELRFAVIDTGIGMTGEQTAQLFKSIRQGDGSATRKYGGTGLGLVICKQLADLLGGTVGVESRPEAGSTFWLRLGFAPAKTLVPRPLKIDLASVEADATTASDKTLAASQPVAESRPIDPALLDRLKTQIDNFDTEAVETLLALKQMAGHGLAPLLEKLDRHLAAFDFDAAAHLLPDLKLAFPQNVA